MTCSCETCGDELCPGDVLCGTCGNECDPDKTLGFSVVRKMDRGCTVEIDYDLVDENGAVIDLTLTGTKLWFTVKDYLTRADSQAAWQGILSSGIEIISSGKIRVTIPAATTQYVEDGIVRLYYDLKLLDALGRTSLIEKGLFEVSPAVTRSIA